MGDPRFRYAVEAVDPRAKAWATEVIEKALRDAGAKFPAQPRHLSLVADAGKRDAR